MNRLQTTFFVVFLFAAPCFAGTSFRVRLDPKVRADPATGRLVIHVMKMDKQPLSIKPFLSGNDDQFGVDARDFKPNGLIDVDDHATFYPVKPSELPPGDYLAQAVLDLHQDDSNWRREPGNLYSPIVPFSVSAIPRLVEISLTKAIEPIHYPTTTGAEIFELRSKLLSDFHHRDIFHRAAVIFPRNYDPKRSYPAIYRVPGFGGDGINTIAHPESWVDKGSAGMELAKNSFQIVLDPESGNGHTLFANSDNNGPRGDALVREFIPALEAKYRLIPNPDARIVRGHSSGGWAALWLTIQYPDVFGACFSISPDPADFHCLERIDIYDMPNAYSDGKMEFPGARPPGSKTVREENQMEEVLGPHNRSGQDWDAWQAVWGGRDSDGNVASLYDHLTGKIDPAQVEHWQHYDITDLLRNDPARYAPIFHQRIRLVAGDQDTFFLNEGVAKLKEELDKHPSKDATGYIRILPKYDHGSITTAPEVQAWPKEMLEQLRKHGLLK